MAEVIANETKLRAARSEGRSEDAVLRAVARVMECRGARGQLAVDLGCGHGHLQPHIAPHFSKYIGVDAVHYGDFPDTSKFIEADLNSTVFPIESKIADAVFAIETIEHLENPRALVREMARIARPGAWIVVTTPNQLSLLSLGTLVCKRHFSAFQEIHYPAHITALLESDLLNIAREVRLTEIAIEYSCRGRIALTPLHFPEIVSRTFPRYCSDSVVLIGRAP